MNDKQTSFYQKDYFHKYIYIYTVRKIYHNTFFLHFFFLFQ